MVIVASLMIVGYGLSSKANTTPAAQKIASTEVQSVAQTVDAEAADAPLPQATCSAIKCPPGKICIDALECTPNGDCFHVGRCVSPP